MKILNAQKREEDTKFEYKFRIIFLGKIKNNKNLNFIWLPYLKQLRIYKAWELY